MEIVKITYEEFLNIKANHYSHDIIVYYACKYLKCKKEDIDDIDWNFKRTFYVYLKEKEEDLIDDTLPY